MDFFDDPTGPDGATYATLGDACDLGLQPLSQTRSEEDLIRTGKPLLIIAEDVEGAAMASEPGTLTQPETTTETGRRRAMLQDIAILTGGQVIADKIAEAVLLIRG
ncbi:MAG: hypothetical protein ACFBSD_07500 [Paracoccaceae bacterium]